MAVIICNMDMPKECRECQFFYFRGIACTGPGYYMDARCYLLLSEVDAFGRRSPFGGCIGEDISDRPGYGDYVYEKHCVEKGKRAEQCPLRDSQKA